MSWGVRSVGILEIRAIKSRDKMKLKLHIETLSFQYPYASGFCLHGFLCGRAEPREQGSLYLQEFHPMKRISDWTPSSPTVKTNVPCCEQLADLSEVGFPINNLPVLCFQVSLGMWPPFGRINRPPEWLACTELCVHIWKESKIKEFVCRWSAESHEHVSFQRFYESIR